MIKDVISGQIKKYVDGNLIEIIDSSGLVTRYEYDIYNRVSRSQILWQEITQKSFTYSYEAGLTLITDDTSGVTEAYNLENNLLYTQTTDGLRYSHTALYTEDNEPISELRLTTTITKDGVTINYSKDDAERIDPTSALFLKNP